MSTHLLNDQLAASPSAPEKMYDPILKAFSISLQQSSDRSHKNRASRVPEIHGQVTNCNLHFGGSLPWSTCRRGLLPPTKRASGRYPGVLCCYTSVPAVMPRPAPTFNFESCCGLLASGAAAVFSGVFGNNAMNDQRVDCTFHLDFKLLAGLDHGRTLLPRHRDAGFGQVTAENGLAVLVHFQILQLLDPSDWCCCMKKNRNLNWKARLDSLQPEFRDCRWCPHVLSCTANRRSKNEAIYFRSSDLKYPHLHFILMLRPWASIFAFKLMFLFRTFLFSSLPLMSMEEINESTLE